jgi:predicted AAA+ superfamily ATPase
MGTTFNGFLACKPKILLYFRFTTLKSLRGSHMKYINRALESELERRLFSGKALILYGPRQCGKTM